MKEKTNDFVKCYIYSLLFVLLLSILMLAVAQSQNVQAQTGQMAQGGAYTANAMAAYGMDPVYIIIFASLAVIFIGVITYTKILPKHNHYYLHSGLLAIKE